MSIQGVSRITGYLSLDERFGSGKYAERADRKSHTDSHTKVYSFPDC
jgi:ribonucleoside-triphosphate reductase